MATEMQLDPVEELRQHILHMRQELLRMNRSPLSDRLKLAKQVSDLLDKIIPADAIPVSREVLRRAYHPGQAPSDDIEALEAWSADHMAAHAELAALLASPAGQ